jgi:hypothetical protein
MQSRGIAAIVTIGLPFALTAGATAQAQCSPYWQPATGVNGAALVATARAGDLIVGGTFTSAGSTVVKSIARWNGIWSAVGMGIGLLPAATIPGGPSYGNALALTTMPNNDVVVGGWFSAVDLTPAAYIARWNGSTWSALGAGTNGNVLALCPLANGDLLVGGQFTSPAAGIARWNGSTWSALGAGISTVEAITSMPNGDVIAGGTFSSAGGTPAANIARWNGSTWSALGTGCNGTVSTLAVLHDGTLVAGGWFNLAGGVSASRVARWDGSTWSPLGLGMGTSQPFGVYYLKKLLVLPNGDLLAAGTFDLAGGVSAHSFARWNGTSWSEQSYGTNGQLDDCTALPNGAVAVVGNFTTPAGRVAILQPNCPAVTFPFGTGCAGAGGLDTLTANGLPWAGSTFHATVTGLPTPAVAIAAYGFTQTSVALSSLLPQGLPGCNALLAPVHSELLTANGSTAVTSVAIPNVSVAIGVHLLAQVVTLETDLSGGILAATSSNGLRLIIGTF